MSTPHKQLAILICTIPERADKFLYPLLEELNRQIQRCQAQDKVQILYLGDNMTIKVGTKRNMLVSMTDVPGVMQCEYVCFLDDDDWISKDYIAEILKGCESGADVISINAKITFNGKNEKPVYYSIEYNRDGQDEEKFWRMPNHLCPMKRIKFWKFPFPNQDFAEDHAFSSKVYKQLNTQYKIDKFIYYYRFDKNVSKTRENWLKDRGITSFARKKILGKTKDEG